MNRILSITLLTSTLIFLSTQFYHFNQIKRVPVKVVSVKTFGARGDGINDDAGAIAKAMVYCIKNRFTCSIPRTSKYYNISSTIRVPLLPGQSLKVISDGAVIKPQSSPVNNSAYNLTLFKEHIFLSIGNQIDNLTPQMFSRSKASSVSVSGLTFDGSSLKEEFAPMTFDSHIFIGLQVLADNVNINKCVFKNIYGYGIRVHNVTNSNITNSSFQNVGGRGATMFAQKIDRDAFGDGIYHSLVKSGGKISISNCTVKGKKMENRRSRSGLTFEYSTEPYRITLSKVSIEGYAKSIHIEESAPTTVNINNVTMSDFNIGIANVLNDRSSIYFDRATIETGFGDGNESGDALAFLNYQSKAKIYVDHSNLDFKGRTEAYQSAVGLVKVQNSTINAHNTNFFFADGSTTFVNCIFVGFGGQGKSFYSNTGTGVYQILNSSFKQSPLIHAKNEKVSLKLSGNKSL